MRLKEAIIQYLELESLEKVEKEKIIKELVEISVEKTLDLIMDEISPDNLKIIGDLDEFQKIDQGELFEKFINYFDKQIKERLYEFRTKSREK